jgi:hypothetical protein
MAVAGVSLSNERHPANVIYNKIHLRYPVKVYPVNPRGGAFKRDRVYRGMESLRDRSIRPSLRSGPTSYRRRSPSASARGSAAR